MLAVTAMLPAGPASARCGRSGVTVYSAYWCPYCKQTEQFLASHGVRYRRIETGDGGRVRRDMLRRFGTAAVPLVIVDGRRWVGHDEARLRHALCLG